MDIFFDHQTFSLQEFGGISRYYAELISGINHTSSNRAFLPLLFSNNVYLKELGLSKSGLLPNVQFYKKQQIIYRSNQAYSISKLQKQPFNVFHATYYDPYFISYLKGRPFTVTFLDMIHEKLSAQFPELSDGGLITKQKQFLANRADRIIAISESTKQDIVELLNVDPNKIDVIYLGNSLKPIGRSTIEKSNPEPYLLFVGRRERYKNFEGLLRAIHPLLKKYRLKLLCAGGDVFSKSENMLIYSLGVNNLIEQRAINDQTLLMLYRQAIAFIFPTLYEGFGIPVLEAFACDCPCIVSNLSSLPEVAGDAAMYIDPTLPESIVEAIEQLLHNSQLRQELVKKGRERLTHFSWSHTVDKTLNLYKALA
jgi:glycosyltransferase involved in cell wall biosynthesis